MRPGTFRPDPDPEGWDTIEVFLLGGRRPIGEVKVQRDQNGFPIGVIWWLRKEDVEIMAAQRKPSSVLLRALCWFKRKEAR